MGLSFLLFAFYHCFWVVVDAFLGSLLCGLGCQFEWEFQAVEVVQLTVNADRLDAKWTILSFDIERGNFLRMPRPNQIRMKLPKDEFAFDTIHRSIGKNTTKPPICNHKGNSKHYRVGPKTQCDVFARAQHKKESNVQKSASFKLFESRFDEGCWTNFHGQHFHLSRPLCWGQEETVGKGRRLGHAADAPVSARTCWCSESWCCREMRNSFPSDNLAFGRTF